MIKGMHAMFYTEKPEETRAFLRDKLGLPFHDVGDGWLLFDVPEADVGCHPAEDHSHGISFYCEDIHETVEELEAEGVAFTGPVQDDGFGLVTYFELPDGNEIMLYEPKYEKE